MSKYFAYGSNMLTNRLTNRVLSAKAIGTARLGGHVLKFNKGSKDHSGKCNVVPTANASDIVFGVVFDVDPTELSKLDKAEGAGYQRCNLTVVADFGNLEVLTYVAPPGSTDDSLRPYTWYRDLVVAGARQHGLPSSYIDYLERCPAENDPDAARDRKNRLILGS